MTAYSNGEVWKDNQFILDLLLNHLPAYIFWKDRNGIYVGCNDGFAQSIGLNSEEDVIGKSDYDLPISTDSSTKYRQDDAEIIKTGSPKLHIEEEQVFQDGTKGWLITNKVPIYNKKQEIIGILGVYADITELKLAKQRAEESNRVKSEFIQNMSHDLRTPLTGLLTVSDCQANALEDNHPLKETFLLIRDASKQLHQFFESILETAKLDYQERLDHPVQFTIEDVLYKVIDLFKPALLSKKLTYIIESMHGGISSSLIGHPGILERILINLISNAIKFTEKGKITIQYGLSEQMVDNEKIYNLQLIVSDTGIGIPESQQKEIFEQFTRIVPSYKGLHEVQGLGLYITNKLMTLLNGNIIVESKGERQGATFRCNIPIQLFSQNSNDRDTLNNNAESNDTYHVLLVDDHKMARQGATMLLKQNLKNCQIDEAETLTSAVKKITEKTYDLVIMDIGLPDGDGKMITMKAKLPASMNQHTPIIALTGHVDQQTHQDCLNHGIRKVVHKPLTHDVVELLINEFFRR